MVGYMNVSPEMDSNLNMSPKLSHGVLECGSAMLQNYVYDFVIQDFYVIHRGVICAGPCISRFQSSDSIYWQNFYLP